MVNIKKKEAVSIAIIISLLLQIYISYATTDVKYYDAWDLEYGTTADSIVWGDFNLYVYSYDVNSEADCLCWDWNDNGASDDQVSQWNDCFCESAQKQEDCETFSPSYVAVICSDPNHCASGVSLTEYHWIDTFDLGYHWTQNVDMREYRDCDNSAGQASVYNHATQAGRPFYVVYRQQYDCDSVPGPATDPDYEGDYDSWVKILANTGMCYSWEECDENHDSSTQDGTLSSVYNEVLDSPCRTKDGYSCSAPADCISDTCGGDHWGYVYDCNTYGDGAADYDRLAKDYDDACGGNGIRYPTGDQDDHYSCTSTYGTGYVCDSYDPQTGNEYTSQQQICNKQLGESCSSNSDCWHYNKGSGTTYCTYGGSASKHCIYSCYEDSACTGSYNDCKTTSCGTANQECYYCVCTDDIGGAGTCDSCLDFSNGNSCDCDGECSSGRCDTTCQAKLAEDQNCDENSDCISNVCRIGGDNKCAGTTESSCTDGIDNDWDGFIDCDDSNCEGVAGPGGKTCCNDGAFNCGTCKYCSSDLCENRAVGYVCNSNYYCSNYPAGDNSYNNGSTRKIPSRGQCDSYQSCDYSSSTPLCDVAENGNQEGENYDICHDGYSYCLDTCNDGLDNDGDGDTDEEDTACPGGSPCDNDYNCESGETPGNCQNDCVYEENPCLYDEQCYDVNYCVHNICRAADPYCTDGYCDYGETCSTCVSDCGSCGGPEIKISPDSLTFVI